MLKIAKTPSLLWVLVLGILVVVAIFFSLPTVHRSEAVDLNVDYSERLYELKRKSYLTEHEREEQQKEIKEYEARYSKAIKDRYGSKYEGLEFKHPVN